METRQLGGHWPDSALALGGGGSWLVLALRGAGACLGSAGAWWLLRGAAPSLRVLECF